MRLHYRIIFIISFLLVTLSISISVINYLMSLNSTHKQLKERSLPLTVDNIYTEIQKHIIEPNLVSSMMAHDTFLKDWLVHDESDVKRISSYLETIKNKYKMFTAFLVSEKTRNYYTSKGLVEEVKEENTHNNWYFSFKRLQKNHEINLDFNTHIDDSMIMFINHKILDKDYHMLGATGIGLRVSYINDMLKRFRQNYNFNVYFVNKSGEVVLSEHGVNPIKHLKDHPERYALMDKIVSKENKILEYTKEDGDYLLNTKYIPELDLYLIVEAKLSHFMANVTQAFYFNLISSLFVTILVTLLILFSVRKYHIRLEYLANNDTLTDLPNRRSFDQAFQHFFMLHKRNHTPISLLFFDLDDFKSINDTFGHQVGDTTLKRVAEILKQNVRKTDILGRWGGEEFIVAFIDSDLERTKVIAEKLREQIRTDSLIQQYVKQGVTASFGLTSVHEHDTTDTLLKRVDEALYKAKANGKNQIVLT